MKIMEQNTDDKHGLTMGEIITALRGYGIDSERKSLYDDFDVLRTCLLYTSTSVETAEIWGEYCRLWLCLRSRLSSSSTSYTAGYLAKRS